MMKIAPASFLLHTSINLSDGFHVGQRFGMRVSPISNSHRCPGPCHASSRKMMPLASSPSYSSSNNDLQDYAEEIVYSVAAVDYSAANEYIRAHYNQSQYFFDASATIDDQRDASSSSKVQHPIYNGRVLQTNYDNEREMLTENGLAIIESPITTDEESINWSDVNDIQSKYLPELERILHNNLFPSTASSPNPILGYCFWNPMMRGETYQISRSDDGSTQQGQTRTPTANIASLVHIDTDVGAYESIQDFLSIVDKNKVQSPSSVGNCDANQTNIKEMAYQIIHEKKRFAIINFWRNTGNKPVTSAPLAILSTRYDTNHNEQLQRPGVFPDARPNINESKWYIFPNATKDEVIVFYQYDRSLVQPSDLWHCAISTTTDHQTIQHEGGSQLEPRRSFDIRALVVLDETVPHDLDRFCSDRTRPILTFEESGCFCDEQAAKRTGE